MPRHMAASYAEERGAVVRRGVTRCTDVLVVGHGAYTLLEAGKLDARLTAAAETGAFCVSENTFLRTVGLLDPVPSEQRSLSMDDLESKSDLTLTDLQLMALFDLIESREGQFGFRDLVSAKEVARLLWQEGATLREILQSVSVIRQYGDTAEGQHLARTKLVKLLEGPLGIRVGDFVADLNGQLRLSLTSPDGPSVDALFEAAEQAEEDCWRRWCAVARPGSALCSSKPGGMASGARSPRLQSASCVARSNWKMPPPSIPPRPLEPSMPHA